MEAAGTADNEYRYFGVKAPRRSTWYNFDIGTYVECAMAGTYGGWQPDDSTGRTFVPGKVAVLEADGSLSSRDT
jgi:hypothetical protein